MSIPREDLITDTDEVVNYFLERIEKLLVDTFITVKQIYLTGSRVATNQVDIHRGSTINGDVDIFLLISTEIPKRVNEDFKQYINGYFRINGYYVCTSLGTKPPKINKLLRTVK